MKRLLVLFFLFDFYLLFAEEIKIGAIMPMSGPLSIYGKDTNKGVSLAYDLQSTLKNGNKIKIILIDNKGFKDETKKAALKLIKDEKVVAILGALTSTNSEETIKVANKYKTPVIIPVATNDNLIDLSEYASRVCFSDSFQGEVIANYAIRQNYKTAIVVVDKAQVYSSGLANSFKKVFEKKEGKLLKKIEIESGSKNFKKLITDIKKLSPDLIFLPLYHPEASIIARELKKENIQIPLFSGDGVANETFIKLGKKAVEGYMFTDFFDYKHPTSKKAKDFISYYQEITKKEEVNSFTVLGADTYNILINAINKCSNPKDKACINREIKNTLNFDGFSGQITIDSSGNAKRSAIIKQIKNKKMIYKDTVNP